MKLRETIALGLFVLAAGITKTHAETFRWPNNARAAVNISYNDSLKSQLDNAVPVLQKYGIKATFYPTLGSYFFHQTLKRWRNVAQLGHELGNHTLFHPCDASKQNREWVPTFRDLNQYAMQEIVEEVALANAFLQALDGRTERTFTYPCAEHSVGGVSYEKAISSYFVASKHTLGDSVPESMDNFNLQRVEYWNPSNVSGKELIDYVKKAAEKGTIANISLHGVGGDYLSISEEAHNELLEYLAKNRDVYWTDTFINITKYIRNRQKK